MTLFYKHLAAALNEHRPFVLALISGTKGSSPQRIGAKALFFPYGKIAGTLGGGCLEAEVHSRAKKAMKSGESSTFEMVLDHDFGWDDGLICGGSVSGLILPRAAEAAELWRKLAVVTEPIRWGVKKDFSIALVSPPVSRCVAVPAAGCGGVSPPAQTLGGTPGELAGEDACATPHWLYIETVSPPTDLWIAGSGHVAQAVVPLALKLDFAVTVFDDRPELANHQFFPSEATLRVGGWHELLKMPLPKSPAFGLIVTRGHQHDALVLSEWIRLPFVFLGMIGSRRKVRIMRENFIKQKIATAEQFAKIACPVGVEIGAVGTREIAVSVMAQFIQKRAELRDK